MTLGVDGGAPTDLVGLLGDALRNPLVIAFLTVLFLATLLSERLAKLEGLWRPIGALARWWGGRQTRRVEKDSDLWMQRHVVLSEQDDARVESLSADVEWLRKDRVSLVAGHRLEVETMRTQHSEELERLRTELREMRERLEQALAELAQLRAQRDAPPVA